MGDRVRVGFVYFVHCPALGMVKIGYSDNPNQRLANLQMGCPAPLVPLGYQRAMGKREQALHLQFGHLRSHGEWFWAGDDLMAYIRDKARPWADQLRETRFYDGEDARRRHRAEVEEYTEWARQEVRLRDGAILRAARPYLGVH